MIPAGEAQYVFVNHGGSESQERNPGNISKDRRNNIMEMLARRTEAGALTLADYEARIHLYKEQIGTGYIGIGRTLNEAKEAGVVAHGQWEQWVTETTGLTVRQAQRCMQAATEIKDGSAMARLEMSKALMLLGSGLEEEQREAIAQKAADEGATVKQLKEELRRAKLQVVQETGASAEIREELKKIRSERQYLEHQLKDTIESYRKRMDEVGAEEYERGRNEMARRAQDLQEKIDLLRGRLEKAVDIAREELDHEYQEALEHANRQNTILAGKVKDARAEAAEEVEEELKELRKARQELLDAAEEAEKRAADAEAELDAVRAGQDSRQKPMILQLGSAVGEFMRECSAMPFSAEELQKERGTVIGLLSDMEDWIDKMYAAIGMPAVNGEGAVE